MNARRSFPNAATSNFNGARFSLLDQACNQEADNDAEHRAKYYEPNRCICDGRPVRFESHLCLHPLSSAEPELIKNAQDRESQSAQYKDNFFDAVVPERPVCRSRLRDRDQTIDRAACR